MTQCKLILTVALLIFALQAPAFINELVTNSFKLDIELDSFQGGEYFPEYDDINYQQQTSFRVGSQFDLGSNATFFFKMRYYHDYFVENLSLDSLAVNYGNSHSSLAYRIFDKKYGSGSYIRNLDASDGNFKKGFLENFRFSGLTGSYDLQKSDSKGIIFSSGFGGNSLNRTLIFTDISLYCEDLKFSMGTIYQGRSNRTNQSGLLSYGELSLNHRRLNIYLAGSYEDYSGTGNHPDLFIFKFHGEAIIPVTSYLSLGGGYSTIQENSNIRKFETKKESVCCLLEGHYKKFNNSLLWETTDAECYDLDKVLNILSYHLTDFWNIGLSTAYISPEPGEDNYQIGFQVGIDYDAN